MIDYAFLYYEIRENINNPMFFISMCSMTTAIWWAAYFDWLKEQFNVRTMNAKKASQGWNYLQSYK
jgi:hypothetical protein